MIDWHSRVTSISSMSSTSSTFSMQLSCQFSHLRGEPFYFVLLEQNSIGVSKLMLAPRHFLAHWARYWKVKEAQSPLQIILGGASHCLSRQSQCSLTVIAFFPAVFHLCLVHAVLLTAMAKKQIPSSDMSPALLRSPAWVVSRHCCQQSVLDTLFMIKIIQCKT